MVRACFLAMAAGCTTGPVALLADSVWLAPTLEDGASGYLTRSAYDGQPLTPRNYLCATVFEVDLEPVEAGCEGCTLGWAVTGVEAVDGDCTTETGDTALELTGVAAGTVSGDILGEAPWPEVEAGGYLRYQDGVWTPHGWVLPDGHDGTVSAPGWDGSTPSTWWPAWALTP